MTNRSKNIISNIIGLIVIGVGFYKYITEDNLYILFLFMFIGFILFKFKSSETKAFLKTLLNKILNSDLINKILKIKS